MVSTRFCHKAIILCISEIPASHASTLAHTGAVALLTASSTAEETASFNMVGVIWFTLSAAKVAVSAVSSAEVVVLLGCAKEGLVRSPQLVFRLGLFQPREFHRGKQKIP